MSKVNTVLGPVLPGSLGVTLVHEHVVSGFPGWECDPLSRPYERDKMVRVCCKALEPLKSFGVGTVVDATPIDLSRDVGVLKEVSDQLNINIICSTGRYHEESGKWTYLKQRDQMGVGDIKNELYEGFMKEITEGVGKSSIKPGAIKIATGANIFSECEQILLEAAAKASKETGIPIITHTEDGTMGRDQAELLLSEGVNPAKVMIGHMCGNPSIGYQRSVLDKKVSIAFDRFGLEYIRSDKARLKTLLELLKRGFAGQIMLSHDRIACAPGRGGLVSENIGRKLVNWSFTNIFKNIIPALKSSGIKDDQIDTMMISNPRRLFGGE